ncbi:uncharacterized protein LOC115474009 isoform X2 [Microcaecilia unicolor]|uniref:Uncharacterized protein LOC115474009 isoform X2 n=1 Tax=Microcaecilia unicolor TaxID=1415580 RepID=A0A6P7YJJ0_9AMPH|nr:uncharacterized protein LOC115474009 isoform X2 [Microcaecilia unicolor]
MSQKRSVQASVIFNKVAIYFSEEEWQLLEEWQKELYRNVMKEIHGTLISLGHKVLNRGVLFRIKNEDMLHHGREEKQLLGLARALVTFHDVAIYFSDEEWQLLEEWQKELYKNVMTEIHEALIILGHTSTSPGISCRIKEEEEPYFGDHDNSSRNLSKRPTAGCPNISPDILLRIKHEAEPCRRDQHMLDGRERISSSSLGNSLSSIDLAKSIKEELEPYPLDLQDIERRGCVSNSTADNENITSNFLERIKEEEAPFFIGYPEFEKRRNFNSPTITSLRGPPFRTSNGNTMAIHQKKVRRISSPLRHRSRHRSHLSSTDLRPLAPILFKASTSLDSRSRSLINNQELTVPSGLRSRTSSTQDSRETGLPLGQAKRSRRFRKPNFTMTELEILVQEVLCQHEQLYGSQSRQTTPDRRKQLWLHIQQAVNKEGVALREIEDVKHKWRDLRMQTSKKMAEARKNVSGSGDMSPVEQHLTPLEQKIATVIPQISVQGVRQGGVSRPGSSCTNLGLSTLCPPGTETDTSLQEDVTTGTLQEQEPTSLQATLQAVRCFVPDASSDSGSEHSEENVRPQSPILASPVATNDLSEPEMDIDIISPPQEVSHPPSPLSSAILSSGRRHKHLDTEDEEHEEAGPSPSWSGESQNGQPEPCQRTQAKTRLKRPRTTSWRLNIRDMCDLEHHREARYIAQLRQQRESQARTERLLQCISTAQDRHRRENQALIQQQQMLLQQQQSLLQQQQALLQQQQQDHLALMQLLTGQHISHMRQQNRLYRQMVLAVRAISRDRNPDGNISKS